MSEPPIRNRLGKYRLLATLGEGGMANVYLAVVEGRAGFSKLVVLKVMRASLMREPEVLALFMDEARLAARLSHPNVVQTNEVGDEDGAHFLAMEYLDGQSLATIGERGSRGDSREKLPLDLHLRILSDALLGLDYAHGLTDFDGSPLRLVHRDVSPQNLFVTYDGRILLLDFGIATAVGRTVRTETGVLRGKLAYMSPEHLAGEAIDHRADLYAFGVMMWEAATGRPLRGGGGGGQAAILARARSADAPSARTVVPSMPERLERICARALARDPDQRYPSAHALRADLEAYLAEAGPPRTARDVGAWVASAFARERADMRARIEKELSPLASGSLPILVSTPLAPSASASARDTTTTAERLPAPRRLGRWLTSAAVAAAVAVTLLAMRGRVSPGSEGSPASVGALEDVVARCTTSRACPDRNVCRSGACVPLVSVDCPEVVGDWADDGAIFVGTLARLRRGTDPEDGGPSLGSSPDIQRAVELGFRELAQTAVGLPGGTEGKPRPLVLVNCNQLVDPVRAARHLVDDVGVPAIIGPATSGVALRVAREVTIPKGVFLISHSATSPELTRMDAGGLFVRTVPSDAFQGAILARVASEMKPKRVALLAKGDTYGASMRDVILRTLAWGDTSLAEHQSAGRFMVRDYANVDVGAFDPAPVVDALAAFAPDLVVIVGTAEALRVIEGLEKKSVQPRYVISDGVAVWDLLPLVASESLRRRVRGTQPRTIGPAYDAFRLRYLAAYPGGQAGTGAASAYDAAYALIYAMATSAPPITGASIARGFRRLVPPGPRTLAEPASIHSALRILEHGGDIDLDGASGPIDFDRETGEVETDLDVFCIGVGVDGKPTFARSGRYFAASKKELVGAFNAPGNPCAY